MNPFESSFIEEPSFHVETTRINSSDVTVSERPRPAFYLVVASMSIALFLPWIVLRIPGEEIRVISLFQMVGGNAMVFSYFFFLSVGILLWIAKVRFGPILTSVAIAIIGWFAVLVSVALGAIRGMIPQVGVGTVDLGRGLVGIGIGAIIVIGALLLTAMETLPRVNTNGGKSRQSLDGFGVIGFLLGLALALSHTAVWVSGKSDKFESALQLSGDSLFGSFLISTLIWVTAIVGVLTALRITEKGSKVLSIFLVGSGLIKFFHALIFILGKGLVNLLLPSSVGEVASVRSHWALWCTLVLSLICILCGFTGAISENARVKMGRLASFEFLPAIVLVLITVLAIFADPIRVAANQTVIEDTTSNIESPVGTSNSQNQNTDSSKSNSDVTKIAKSVVLVLVKNAAGEECWSGSGVAVLDGTFILTNEHIVVPESSDDQSCTDLTVGITTDTSEAPESNLSVVVISKDSELDLALLRLRDTSSVKLRPLPIRNELMSLDSKIRVIGYPGVGGDTITVNEGIISGIDRARGAPFYKVSAQISPGNSGGPMVDENGNLVGIASAYVPAEVRCDTKDDCYAAGANLGLVRPISYAQDVLNQR